MNNATSRVLFKIIDDELEVTAPPALAPLADFLETEVGTSDVMLDLIEHHVRHDRVWRFTGNACRLHLDGEAATIEHDHTGARTTITRPDLSELLANLRTLLAED